LILELPKAGNQNQQGGGLMNKQFFSILALLGLGFTLSFYANAATEASTTESSFEITCRSKAKELASDTYRSCVTENRNAELDRIRKDYQERLRALKDDYNKDLEKLGGKQEKNKTHLPKNSWLQPKQLKSKAPSRMLSRRQRPMSFLMSLAWTFQSLFLSRT
jgi:hypothetical protein